MSKEFKVRNLFDDFHNDNGSWSKNEKNSNGNSKQTVNQSTQRDLNQHKDYSFIMDLNKNTPGTSREPKQPVQEHDTSTIQNNQKMSDGIDCKDSDSEDTLYIDLKYCEPDIAEEENTPDELKRKSSDASHQKYLQNKEETSCALEKVTNLLENNDKCPVIQDDSGSGSKSYNRETVTLIESAYSKNSIQTDSELPYQDISDRKVENCVKKVTFSESKSEEHSIMKNQQNIESIPKTLKDVVSNNNVNQEKAVKKVSLGENVSEQNIESNAGKQSKENMEKHVPLIRVSAQDGKKTENECVREELVDTIEISTRNKYLVDTSKDVKDCTASSSVSYKEECTEDNSVSKIDGCDEVENFAHSNRIRSPNERQETSRYPEKTVESNEEHGKTRNDQINVALDRSGDVLDHKAVDNVNENDDSSLLNESNVVGKNLCQKESISCEGDASTSSDDCLPSGGNSITDTNNQRIFTTNFSFKYIKTDKTFKCSCSFSTDSDMIFEIHLIVNHLISRPYRCFYCKSCFESMDEMKHHQATLHPGKSPKSSLIGMKRAKQISLRGKCQDEYIHRQRKPSSDACSQNARKCLEEGTEIQNEEAEYTSTVTTKTPHVNDKISNFSSQVVTPGKQVTETVAGNSNSVGCSSMGLVQQPHIGFNRFQVIPVMNPPGNAMNNESATNIARNTVGSQKPNIAICPTAPIMNRPMIPFAPGLTPILHMKTVHTEPMSNARCQNLPMSMIAQNVTDFYENINLYSEHHQLTSGTNSIVLGNSNISKSNPSSTCTSSGNIRNNSNSDRKNNREKTIARQNDASQTFNQSSSVPCNPPQNVDCFINSSSVYHHMSTPSTSSYSTSSNLVTLPIFSSVHHIPSASTSKTSSVDLTLNSAHKSSTIENISTASYRNTSNSTTFSSTAASNSSTNTDSTITGLSTNSNPTASNLSTSSHLATFSLSTCFNPATSNLLASSDPTTSNASTRSDPVNSDEPVIKGSDKQHCIESLFTRESLLSFNEKIKRITQVFSFENNFYLCKSCSIKWSERETFWFHVWKHVHYKNGPCSKCNVEKSYCSTVERLLFVLENETKYKNLLNKYNLITDKPQHSEVSDTIQSSSLESSSNNAIIISDDSSPIFIDLSNDDFDEYIGEEHPAIKEEDIQIISTGDSPLVTVQKFIANNGHMKPPKEMTLVEFDQKKQELASEITILLRNITEENGKPVSGQSSEELERVREKKKLDLILEIFSKSTSNSSKESLTASPEYSTSTKDQSSYTKFPENSSKVAETVIKDSIEKKDAVANTSCVSSGKDRNKLAHHMAPQFYACSACPFSTLVLGNYRKHLLNEHSKQVLICIHCGFKTDSTETSVKHLLHHSKVHNPQIPVFQCCQKDCPYQCNTLRDFIKHVKGHSDYVYKCHCCESYFNSVNELQEHYQCSFLTIVTCPTCRARSTDKQSMLKHIAKHHPDKGRMLSMVKQLICKERKENNFSFSKVEELQRQWSNVEDGDIEFIEQTTVDGPITSTDKDRDNVQDNGNENSKAGNQNSTEGNENSKEGNENSKAENEDIGQTLHVENISVSSIDEPQSTSTNISGYTCDKCSFVADRSSSLDDHIAKHQDQKPFSSSNDYSCSICPTNFNQIADFENHLQQHNEKIFYTIYECSIDGYRTNILSKIIEHVKDEFHLQTCGKDNLYTEGVVMLETKVLHCAHCPYKCLCKKDMLDHKKSHGISSDSESLSLDSSCHIVSIADKTNKGGEDFDTFDREICKFYYRVNSVYNCKLCGKKFRFKKTVHHHLNNHIAIPFQCASCWFSSKQLSAVTSHIRDVHHSDHTKVHFSGEMKKRLQKLLSKKGVPKNNSKVKKKSTSSCVSSQKINKKAHSSKTSIIKDKSQQIEVEVYSQENSENNDMSIDTRNEPVELTKEISKVSDNLVSSPTISGFLDKEKAKAKILPSVKVLTAQNSKSLAAKDSGAAEEQKRRTVKDSTILNKKTTDDFSSFMHSLDDVPRKKKKSGDKITEKETKNMELKLASKSETVKANILKKSLNGDLTQKNTECKESVSVKEHSVTKPAKKHESAREVSIQYECPKCDFQTVFNEPLMRSHLETHNFINIYECKKCSAKFHSFQQIKCHINFLHHGPMDFNLIPVIDIPIKAFYKKGNVIANRKRKSSNTEAHTSKPKKCKNDSKKMPSTSDETQNKKEMNSTRKPKILSKESKSKTETCTDSKEPNLNEISSNDEDDFIVVDEASQEEFQVSSSIACHYCHKEFSCVYDVSKHIKKNHRQTKKVWWKDLKSGCVFNENGFHVQQSDPCYHENKFLCNFCSCRSMFRRSINNHLRKAHKENPPKSVTKLRGKIKTADFSSSKKPSGSDPVECPKIDGLKYLCPVCNYSSHQLSIYSRHLAKHKRFLKVAKQKIWKCSVCTQRIFKKRHIKTHSCVMKCDPEKSLDIIYKDVNKCVDLNPTLKVVNAYSSIYSH